MAGGCPTTIARVSLDATHCHVVVPLPGASSASEVRVEIGEADRKLRVFAADIAGVAKLALDAPVPAEADLATAHEAQ